MKKKEEERKKPERRKKKNISYLPGVVALAAVAVAFGVELSGLHKSTHVFVVYIQRYMYAHTHNNRILWWGRQQYVRATESQ